MGNVVKISLALFMALSMIASGLGVDIYYHYCGHTGDSHTSLFFRTDCGPGETSHGSQSCCGIAPLPVEHDESCCHGNTAATATRCAIDSHCSDKYEHHSEEIISTVNYSDEFTFIVACNVIKSNRIYNHNTEVKGEEGYIAHIPPLINSPFKKLFIFTSMRISPEGHADMA